MSLLDTASLVITPNGYKEGKLYSVLPSDGSGDLSVTRATTATRVNASGLVELVPYNFIKYSQDFSNAVWESAGAGVTLTSGQSDPFNGTNAYKLTKLGNASRLDQLNVVTSGQVTLSIYAKAGSNNWISISNDVGYSFFNILNGTIGVNDTSTPSIQSVGNGWFRCSIIVPSHGNNIRIYPVISDGSVSGSTGDIYIYGAQLVQGSTVKDYQKTETRLNVPRLDYSNGTCPSILVEPQRTNLLTYSEDFTNAAWLKVDASGNNPVVTPNFAISPDGSLNADKIVFSASSGVINAVFQYFPNFAGTRTGSIWLRSETGASTVYITTQDDLVSGNFTTCNLTTQWQRFEVSYNVGAVSTQSLIIGYYATSGTPTGPATTTTIYAWGAQVEAGSYATSYIPTTSASVTRNADVISKTGISSLIGQTEGTIFVDFYVDDISSQLNSPVVISLGVDNNIEIFPSGRVVFYDAGGCDIDLLTFGLTNGRHKFAFGLKTNDFVAFIDGVLVGTDTSGTPSSNSSIYLGYTNTNFIGKIDYNTVALWKTRLTNSQLQTLTTI